jgi:hypothetical protein
MTQNYAILGMAMVKKETWHMTATETQSSVVTIVDVC